MSKHITAWLLALALAGFCFGQSDKDLQSWMKDLGATNGKLRKEVAAKATEDAAKDAQHVAVIYKSLEEFFSAKSMADAVKMSQDGRKAAEELAANAGDETKAGPALKAIGGTCSGCHTAHREKLEDGTYKLK
jgi:cytochrome c556